MRDWKVICAGVCILGLAVGAAASGAEDETPAPAVDPRATELVTSMARTLASLKAIRFATEYTVDVVLESGQKIQYGGASTTWLRRPNALRTERLGERASTLFIYDGTEVTLYAKPQNFYATREAPATLDALHDYALDRLDVTPPGVDLLYSDGGLGLLEGVTSGTYVGATTIAGRRCHHVAFRAPDVDWQLWIEEGERPLPCRYVITTLDVEHTPEMAVTYREWDTEPELSDELFTFTAPEGAKRIVFGEPEGRAAEATEEGSE
jgi:hypothetical protein